MRIEVVQWGFLYNGSTYSTLDDPVATGETDAIGFSGSNVVGIYMSSHIHGFLYNGSTYTTLDGPLGTWSNSYATGIDGDRIIGGHFDALSGTSTGFIATVPEPSGFLLAR